MLAWCLVRPVADGGIVSHAASPTPTGSYRYRKLLRSGREAELRVRISW
jgi:hypothetical protein